MSKVTESIANATESIRDSRIGRNATLAAIAAFSLLIAGCGSEYPGFDHSDSPQQFASFFDGLYKRGKVLQCSGKAVLAYGGHVRSMPYLPSVQHFLGTPDPDNLIPQYTIDAETKAVTLVDPQLIQLDSPGASTDWYVQQTPSGQEVFVNDVALGAGNFNCSTVAHLGEQPGMIQIG